MNILYVCLAVLVLRSQVNGFYRDRSMSVQTTTDCQPVYMCPTFCLKSKGKCFVCQCGESMKEFMKSAIFQTGRQFTNGLMNFGSHHSSVSASKMAPFSTIGTMGANKWMSSGSQSAGSSQWMGGGSTMTGVGKQWSGGQGSVGVVNQGKLAPMLTSYLQPDFQEFYRPISGVMPWRCPQLDRACPSKCWKINGFTGCMHCACPLKTTVTTPTSQYSTDETKASVSTNPTLSTRKQKSPATFTSLGNSVLSIPMTTPLISPDKTTSQKKSEITSRVQLSSPSVISPSPFLTSMETQNSSFSTATLATEKYKEMTNTSQTATTMSMSPLPFISLSTATPSTTLILSSTTNTSQPEVNKSSPLSSSTNTSQPEVIKSSPSSPTSVFPTPMTTASNLPNLELIKSKPLIREGSAGLPNSIDVKQFGTSDSTIAGKNTYLKEFLGTTESSNISVNSKISSLKTAEPIQLNTSKTTIPTPDNITPQSETVSRMQIVITPQPKPLQTFSTKSHSTNLEPTTKARLQMLQSNTDKELQHDICPETSTAVSPTKQDSGPNKDQYDTLLKFFRYIDSGEKEEAIALLQNLLAKQSSTLATTFNNSSTEVLKSSANTVQTTNTIAGVTYLSEPYIQPTLPSEGHKSNATDQTGIPIANENGTTGQPIPYEPLFCPETKHDCDINCHVLDTLRECTLCMCDSVDNSHHWSSLATSMASLLNQEPKSVCRPIPDNCEDDCLFLDGENYFCPVCRCERDGHSGNSPETILSSASVEIDDNQDQRCAPLPEACPAQCVTFDSKWCVMCSCDVGPNADMCPPLDKNCPPGCGGFNTDTFCPMCNCENQITNK